MGKIKDNPETVKNVRAFSQETENFLISSIIPTSAFVNVLFWFLRPNSIHGIGTSKEGIASRIELTIKPYVILWARRIEDVQALRCWRVADTSVPLELIPELSNLKMTGITPIDLLLKTNMNCEWKAYKYPVKQFFDCYSIYRELRRDSATRIVKIPGIWNVKFFLLLHMYLLKGKATPIFNIYINSKLELDSTPVPTMTQVYFDFETISHENTRFPTGTNQTDIMFSASIIVNEKLYTIVNLPLSDVHSIENAVKFTDFEEHEIIVVHSEYELLTKVCSIFDEPETFYSCYGFNSTGYDIPYLAQRLTYLSMPQARNIMLLDGVLIYGKFMIHIDLYPLSIKFSPELPSHSLRSVSEAYLTGVTKDDFNAVEIRHVYRNMISTNQIDPTVATICKYNDQDTYILYRIVNELQYHTFLPELSATSSISLSRIAMCGIDENVSTKTVFESFGDGSLLVSHPRYISTCTPDFFLFCDTYKMSEGEKENSYPGGFNYFSKTSIHDNVYMLDFVSYYPYLIDQLNLSYENVTILPAGILKALNLSNCDYYRYCIHAPDLARRYINGTLDNGSQITDLDSVPEDERIIVHVPNFKGIATITLNTLNALRNKCKENKKCILPLLESLGAIDHDDLPEESAIPESAIDPIPIDIMNPMARSMIRIPMLSKSLCKTMSSDLLYDYLYALNGEQSRLNCDYRYLKIANSSIGGGLIGGAFGALRSRTLVASVTALGRKWLIDVYKYAASLDPKIELLLADTDSMFLSNVTKTFADQICNFSNTKGLALNYKVYRKVMCLRKKCYVYLLNNEILTKSIQTRGGPALWSSVINQLIKKFVIDSTSMQLNDIFDMWWSAFYDAHVAAQQDLTLLFLKHRLGKDLLDYKQLPKVIARVLQNDPGYKFQDYYYTIFVKGAKITDRVEKHTDTELSGIDASQLNLLFFYNNIAKSLYHITSTLVSTTLAKKNIYFKLPSATFNDMSIRTYDVFNSMVLSKAPIPITCPMEVYTHQLTPTPKRIVVKKIKLN